MPVRKAVLLALAAIALVWLAPMLALAADAVPRDAHRYQRLLTGHARAVWGLEAPVAVFAAQTHQESAWRSDARSRAGALGLGQFMPGTADWISGLYGDLAAGDPMNPSWALRALVRYDQWLYVRTIGDTTCDRWAFALSGYNGGAGWVARRKARSPQPGSYRVTGFINPGIHPANQRENESYAVQILTRWQPLYAGWGPGVSCVGIL